MDDEVKTLVEEVKNISLENQKILKSIQRRAHMGMLMHTIYWVVIASISVGVFYYIEPYFDEIKGAYDSLKEVQHKVSDFSGSFGNFKNFIPGN